MLPASFLRKYLSQNEYDRFCAVAVCLLATMGIIYELMFLF